MSGLLDQFGEPARRAYLESEVAAPSMGGLRSPFSSSPADGLSPALLSALHHAAANGDSLASLELAEDIEERDPHYSAVLSTRRRQLIQQPITIEPASDAADHQVHANFIRDWLKGGVLQQSLFDLTDAIGKGFSVLEIVWDCTPQRTVPRKLLWRPQRWFEIDWTDGVSIKLRGVGGLDELDPRKFLVHKHPFKSGLVTRSSLARLASWSWMYKAFTLRDWAIFVQNYGMPVRVGRYGPDTSETDKRVLWRAVSQIAGDAAAIIPKSTEIEFIEAKGAHSGKSYEERCDWLNREISKAVLGQTTTTDAVSGGHAVSQEHRLVQEDIERADCMMVGWTLTTQVVERIIAINFGPQDIYPQLRLGQLDQVPLPDVIAAVADLGPLGLRVKTSEMLERLNFSKPDPQDEVIGAPAPGAAAPGETPVTPPQDKLIPNARLPTTGVLGALGRQLVSLQAEQAPELVERLTQRVAEDAQGALAGLTEAVRAVFDEASDMHDLAHRLSMLQLDPKAFATAMQRGMALANLVGQASLLDEIHPGR